MHPYVPTLLALLLMTTTCQSILLGKIMYWRPGAKVNGDIKCKSIANQICIVQMPGKKYTTTHTNTHTHTEELVKEQIKLPSHASTRYTHKQIPTNVLATDELGELILIGASREEKREARNSTYVLPLRTYVLHTLFDHHAPTHQICSLCSPVKEKSGIN